jgi:hypothetical protein
MRTSDSIASIAPAIVKAQAVCHAVVKDKTAKVQSPKGSYEYNYSDFASVVEVIKPALAANELAMIQWAERATDGITVVTRLQHASGEWQETDTPVPGMFVSAQTLGSGFTYGKRYGAQAAMLLPSQDDDGKAATEGATPRPNTAKQVATDAFDELSIADQKYLQDLAVVLIDMTEGNDDAWGYLESKRLSTEHKLALWALLPSNVRTALKKAQNAAAVAKAAPALASQP